MKPESKNELVLELQNVLSQLRRSNFAHHHHASASLRDSEQMMLFMVSRLNDGKPVTTSEIATKTGVTLAAVTHRVNVLEKAGLIKRVPHETDRRVVYISLSAKGERRVKKLEKMFAGKIGKITDFLGPQDTKALIRIIKKMADFPQFLRDNKKDA